MPKVLILGNSDLVIWNFRKELVERLLKEGYEVCISSPYGETIEYLRNMGCQYVEIPISRHGTNIAEDIKLLFKYWKLTDQIKPDCMLTYTIKPNIYGGLIAEIRKIPYLVNITGLGTAVEHPGALQRLTVVLYRIALHSARKVYFQNVENQQFFEKRNIAIARSELLPGSGVNLTKYHVLPYPPEDTIHFVFISRIMKEKGIEEYLKAAEKIKSTFPNTCFHICGFCEEDYRDKLEEMEEEEIIIYHGMVKDVREILKICHCTVHPSYYPEGMSNVLLESCACGRPIITTDRSGCREVVVDDENGYMIPQKDTGALVQSLVKFIKLPYERKKKMGLLGRQKVEKEFDRNIVVNAYLKELASL